MKWMTEAAASHSPAFTVHLGPGDCDDLHGVVLLSAIKKREAFDRPPCLAAISLTLSGQSRLEKAHRIGSIATHAHAHAHAHHHGHHSGCVLLHRAFSFRCCWNYDISPRSACQYILLFLHCFLRMETLLWQKSFVFPFAIPCLPKHTAECIIEAR